MATLIEDCPRCRTKKVTFDILAQQFRGANPTWQMKFELFCVCRACRRGTIQLLEIANPSYENLFMGDLAVRDFRGDITNFFDYKGYISAKDIGLVEAPDHLPENILRAFDEASRCMSVEAYNGAGAMFRLCLDLATKPLLPNSADSNSSAPNEKQRRDLGLRLAWLFENDRLPKDLRELAKCIREDANDGAHVGSLSKEDLLDFTKALLQRLISEPARIKIAEERRVARREASRKS